MEDHAFQVTVRVNLIVVEQQIKWAELIIETQIVRKVLL